MSPRVLIIDDEANIRRMLAALLAAEGYEVDQAASGAAGAASVADRPPDAVLLDLMMPPGQDGLTTLEQIRAKAPEVPVVMMSGQAHITDAVRATKLGAFQFLEKPLTPESLLVTLKAALSLRRALAQNRALHEQLGHGDSLVGLSAAMHRVRDLIARVAPTEARVLITGESGTGKELVASAIHRASKRAEEAFVCVNCAAIPRDLVESELFGHERGAFTGATERRIGRFELADGGTLFLDEVGDLGPEAQAKLLRALEADAIERVGGEKPIRIQVRTIAATNKDLTRATRDGNFREDLLFRLNVFPINIPPLRERPEDIEPLIAHFADKLRGRLGRPVAYDAGAMALLRQYSWPGNVRELANILERLAILSPAPNVTASDVERVLPASGRTAGPADSRTDRPTVPPPAAGDGAGLAQALDEYERSMIARALSQAQGNVAEAARRLATDRANLYRRMRRLGLEPPRRVDAGG